MDGTYVVFLAAIAFLVIFFLFYDIFDRTETYSIKDITAKRKERITTPETGPACQSNKDCGKNYNCYDGQCLTKKNAPAGAMCSRLGNRRECGKGLSCVLGVCYHNPAAEGQPCFPRLLKCKGKGVYCTTRNERGKFGECKKK